MPELDRNLVEDLILGCGQPAGESGYNLARIVAIQAGMANVPGVTINRYCSSSLMSIRMAAHAIKSGEGDVFVAAGVETVSRFLNGMADGGPHNPLYADAEARTAERTAAAQTDWAPDRGLACPTSTSPWARRPRTSPTSRRCRREEQDEFAALSQQRATASLENGFWENEITPVVTKDDEGNEVTVTRDDGIRAGTTAEGLAGPQAGVPPRGHRHRRQRLPAQRRRRRRRGDERHPGQGAGPHPARPHRVVGASPASTPRSWASARSRPSARPCPAPA